MILPFPCFDKKDVLTKDKTFYSNLRETRFKFALSVPELKGVKYAELEYRIFYVHIGIRLRNIDES
jgi:hypothetical protein